MTPREYWAALRGTAAKPKIKIESVAPRLHVIPEEVYAELAEQVVERIGNHNYIATRVQAETENFVYNLVISACIYWAEVAAPDGNYRNIADIVPVWWELHSYEGDDGLERLNDATFEKIKQHIIIR